MLDLYTYEKYAQCHTPKDVALELMVLARRLNYIITRFTEDESRENILENLEDVNSPEKVIEQIKIINGLK